MPPQSGMIEIKKKNKLYIFLYDVIVNVINCTVATKQVTQQSLVLDCSLPALAMEICRSRQAKQTEQTKYTKTNRKKLEIHGKIHFYD